MTKASDYRVRRYVAADKSEWDDFVSNSKNGTFLFMRDYMDYHADRYHDWSLMVFHYASRRLVALLPANRRDDGLISHGGLTYGGLVTTSATNTSTVLDILAALIDHCRGEGIDELIYKAIPAIYHKVPADEDKYAMFHCGAELYRREVLSVVDFSASVEMQERRRRGARKAAANGLRVAKSMEFGLFWPILTENLFSRHRVRPVHSLAEIELLQRRFPSNISLHGVFGGDQMYAGTVLYHAGPAIHVQYSASIEPAREIGALDLLYTTLIAQFSRQARFFDFGNSNEDEGRRLNRGLADFKEGFGARAVCHDFYKLPLRK